MRPKKSKKVRKALQKLQRSFSFRKPFQLLFDDALMAHLDKVKFPITVINNTFDYPKLFTSRCLYRKYHSMDNKNAVEKEENSANDHQTDENGEHECDSMANNSSDTAGTLNINDGVTRGNANLTNNQKHAASKTKDRFVKHIEIRNCLHKGDVDPTECMKRFVRKSNAKHYLLGCVSNSSKYKDLKNVPLVIFRRNGTLLLDTDNFGRKSNSEE
ncbi:hypothetical protein VCUG_00769 [Vavraia culicis subsp. floridensis]|uniref:Uncharacterized protein n=1 Tax=Vavraia culicis (isolate floridensis) TaxID=948595 RepID=L2GWE4_VAVCU|nr:uncharacterized protein VCUG_00769 [Vavraia culicis subsp. floridensis]ELA47687.1 hypothetical protein VCUG_00769 [Vavraia culicis subsp. floridensis]